MPKSRTSMALPFVLAVAAAAAIILPRPFVRGMVLRLIPPGIALARLQLTALATGFIADAINRRPSGARRGRPPRSDR